MALTGEADKNSLPVPPARGRFSTGTMWMLSPAVVLYISIVVLVIKIEATPDVIDDNAALGYAFTMFCLFLINVAWLIIGPTIGLVIIIKNRLRNKLR